MKIIILLYSAIIISASFAILFVKKGVNNLGELNITLNNFFPVVWKLLTNMQVLIGIFFYGLLAIAYFLLLSKANLNVAASLIAGSVYIVAVLISLFYFKESIPILSWIGIGFICLGMYLISRHMM